MYMCHRLLEYESDQIGKLQVYHFSREPRLRESERKPISVETIIVGHPSSGELKRRRRVERDRLETADRRLAGRASGCSDAP